MNLESFISASSKQLSVGDWEIDVGNSGTLKTGTTPFTYGYLSSSNKVLIKASFSQRGIEKSFNVKYTFKSGTANEVALGVGALETIDSTAFANKLWNNQTRSLTDKTGFALTASEIKTALKTTNVLAKNTDTLKADIQSVKGTPVTSVDDFQGSGGGLTTEQANTLINTNTASRLKRIP